MDAALVRIAGIAGAGSQAARREELDALFSRATEAEQRFLAGLLLGELRQGALEGVMAEAVAKARERPAARGPARADALGRPREVAEAALAAGADGLARFRLTPLQPIQPMLAQTGRRRGERARARAPALVEWKLDGARIQAHRSGDEVRVFTRNLATSPTACPRSSSACARSRPSG